jgi:hypothetical protein
MKTLLHPITRQPCEFVASLRGMVAIRCNYVSRQVRWFDLQLMQLCNPAIDIATLIPQDFDSGLLYTVPMPPGFVLEVEIPINMLDAINHTGNVDIVRKPAPITVYHSAMREAA